MPGAAVDVAAFGNSGVSGQIGRAYVIGTDHGIFRWNAPGWAPVGGPSSGGGALRIAVGQDSVWVVTTSGDVFHKYRETDWDSPFFGPDGQTPIQAWDIGVGGYPERVWLVGHPPHRGWRSATSLPIYRLNLGTRTFELMPSVVDGGLRISVDGRGYAWIIDGGFQIQRFNGTAFEPLPKAGSGSDIAIASGNGDMIYIVGTDGNVYIWLSDDLGWTPVNRGPWGNVNVNLKILGADLNGPWVVSEDNAIYATGY